MKRVALLGLFLSLAVLTAPAAAQDAPPRIFISVDMEGVGGIGSGEMTRTSGGKGYATGRNLMTAEVNAVVAAILALGPAEILVNDSHGDMQNLMHTELDPSVEYIQSNIKPLGMVQGLDASYDGAIFLGYHARAGDLEGFLAHTGSGAVKGLWLNGVEVGEGGLNAAYAGALGVPVILAAGDDAFAREISELMDTRTVVTKTAVTPPVRAPHPPRACAPGPGGRRHRRPPGSGHCEGMGHVGSHHRPHPVRHHRAARHSGGRAGHDQGSTGTPWSTMPRTWTRPIG